MIEPNPSEPSRPDFGGVRWPWLDRITRWSAATRSRTASRNTSSSTANSTWGRCARRPVDASLFAGDKAVAKPLGITLVEGVFHRLPDDTGEAAA